MTGFARLKALWRRYWLPALLALTLWADIAGAVNLWHDIGRPFGGYMLMHNLGVNTWQIDEATPPWWSGVNNGGLTQRDTLITVNGQGDLLDQERIYQTALADAKPSVEIIADRRGMRVQASVPILIFTARHFFEIKLPDLIIGFSFWLLALMIYRLRPTEPLNRAYALIGSLAATMIMSWRHSLFADTTHFSHFLWFPKMLGLSAGFLCPLAIHATIMLTTPDPERSRVTLHRIPLQIGYALALLSSLMWWGSRISLWLVGWTPFSGRLDKVAYAMALIGGIIAFAYVLLRLARVLIQNHTPPRVRKHIFGILVGFAIALPMIAISFRAGLTLPGSTYCCGGLDLRYLYLAIPLAFAFVILRYQAFRGTHPVFVLILLLSVSALLASIGDWLVRQTAPTGGVGAVAPGLALSSSVPPFVPILAVVFAASTAGVFLPRWFGRLFRWESSSYGAVRQFGQEMIHRLDLATLPDDIVATLASTLQLDQVGLWLRQPGATPLHLAAEAGLPKDGLPEVLSPPADELLVHPAVIGLDASPVAAWLRPLQACGFEAVAPLRAPGAADATQETWLGLLALGKRVDEEIFHARDLEIVELIGQQAALFLLTAQQIEHLREVPRRMTEAQERDRFKLAQELHDTVQQFLGRLPFFLEVSRRDVRSQPERAEALLQRCIADSEEAARTVRQIRGALAPIQLDNELAEPLQNLLDRFRARTEWVVEADIAPDVDDGLSPEARHALFRVIQQALDNAEAHAKGASRVWVVVQGEDGRVTFSVRDDGSGFTEAERAQAEAEGHFGLRSMQDRITSLGGELAVTSGPEGGATVQGWLPADRN
ncbi:MAG: hypothetical protein K1X65_12560 [Caldilineales bacterium]|nr:hypothetical protein [Caldilineales bacterium]